MSDSETDLFIEEEHLFEKSDQLLKDFNEIILDYKKILKENKKLIKISDKQQKIINCSIKNNNKVESEDIQIILEDSMFFNENNLLEKTESTYKDLSLFIKSNKKLLIQTKKLVKISDRQQKMITESRNKLESNNSELIETNKKINELNNTKDLFFSIISHDLRGPIGSSKSFLEVLLSNETIFNDQLKRKNILEILYNTMKTTFNLLDNLLFWARAQKGEIKFNPVKFDIIKLIDENIQFARNNAKLKNINLESTVTDKSIFVYADIEMVNTIMRNLLSNAIKFTKNDGIIKINSKVIDNFLEINVSDNGVGIDEDKLKKLFKIEYKQNTLGTNKETGTGLGLFLCKDFVEKNNGKIWIVSKKNIGTDVYFTLSIKNN